MGRRARRTSEAISQRLFLSKRAKTSRAQASAERLPIKLYPIED